MVGDGVALGEAVALGEGVALGNGVTLGTAVGTASATRGTGVTVGLASAQPTSQVTATTSRAISKARILCLFIGASFLWASRELLPRLRLPCQMQLWASGLRLAGRRHAVTSSPWSEEQLKQLLTTGSKMVRNSANDCSQRANAQ
jgi:hypothetical protein